MCQNDTCAKMDWFRGKKASSFYGLNDLEFFFMEFESVVENQILPVLDIALKATPSHWWGTHKEKINNWFQCKRLLRIRFGAEQENKILVKHDGFGKPKEHVDRCMVQWRLVPP